MTEKVIIGNAELWHGDCREILPTLPHFDLILTDPPYGIGADVRMKLAAGKISSGGAAYKKDYGYSNWDSEPPPRWLIELIRTKADFQILFGGNYFELPPASCWLVWDKDNGTTKFADFEMAWTNLPKASRIKKYMWNGMLQQNMKNKEFREHPTQKPVPIMYWCLEQVSDFETVCDPFIGSGTTGVACAQMGKAFTGIERERKYFDIACERIERAQAQGQLLPHEPVEKSEQAAMF